ncbi:MAG: hypothetical protein D4Q79_02225 [Spirochaetia bacterium]|nr:MAG: hypothetical protein D4Q79_02225 [Spirochaetia bacterium]
MSTTAVLVLPFFIASLVVAGPLVSAVPSHAEVVDALKSSPLQTQKTELLAQSHPILKESSVLHDSANKSPKAVKILATAYSSSPDETDDTPFITASGSRVRNGVIAANFLPFGAKVRLPGVFGDKVFTVEDRLKESYNDRVDIWFPSKGEALEFGVQVTEMEIL